MRLSFIFCLILSLVASKKKSPTVCENQRVSYAYIYGDSAESSEERTNYVHDKSPLDLNGKIRHLFAVEIGLEAGEANLICSPISAMMPLAKLVLGAESSSKTEKELLDALGLTNTREIEAEYTKTIEELQYLKGVEISIASRFYVSKKHKLQAGFKRNSKVIFDSAMELIDTKHKEEVAKKINEWVADITKNKITNLISPDDIDSSLSLLLVNAIYFKGSWRSPFKPATLQPFHSPAGEIQVPMMTISGRFNYTKSEDLNAKIIELPYEGEEAAMIIVLPNDKKGLPILLRALKLSDDLLRCAMMDMRNVKVDVSIPKFKIETTLDLKYYYKKMGVSHALSPETSELTNVIKHETVFISSAKQKAIIEVSEEGTVAAAGSATGVIPLMHIKPFEFTANHPFLFYIRARNEQLFAGVVNNP